MKKRLIALAALLLVVALVASACTNDGSDPAEGSETPSETLPQDLPDLEFGRGELPITVPSNFPIPEQTVIAGTMIDGTRELTEVVFTTAGTPPEVAGFYETNLPANGYEVTSSEGTDAKVTIEFVGNGIEGVIKLTVGASGVTAGTLVFTYV